MRKKNKQTYCSNLLDSIRLIQEVLLLFYFHELEIVLNKEQNYAISSLQFLHYPFYHTNLSTKISVIPVVLLRN